MKARELKRLADRLDDRERSLHERFLKPVATETSWTPDGIDHVAAYVGLLHSEAEHTLEQFVRMVLLNALLQSTHYQPHPILINSCVYYSSELNKAFGKMSPVPPRAKLQDDRLALTDAWMKLGTESFFLSLLSRNHGAGLQYVERLFHPLGIVITPKSFQKLTGIGVIEVLNLGATTTTTLTEFVILRGSAVHAGTRQFAEDIRDKSPQDISSRGRGVVTFVHEVAAALMLGAWRRR